MEYTKDVFFKVNYNTDLNRLEIAEESWTSKLIKKIKNHKLLTTIVIAFAMFSTLNIAMIYSFMKILQNNRRSNEKPKRSTWIIYAKWKARKTKRYFYYNIGGGNMSSKYPILPPLIKFINSKNF